MPVTATTEPPVTPAIDIENLAKTYDNGHVALKGIDLQVAEGDFFGLLGRNGAGKSTTIGIISSLINKSSGTVRIFGVDIDENFIPFLGETKLASPERLAPLSLD